MPTSNILNFEPGEVAIRAREDATISFPVQFNDELGAAIDVSSKTYEAAISNVPGGYTQLDATIDMTDAATGTVVVTFDLATLTSTNYVWDLWDVTGGTASWPVIGGPVTVSKRVTT